MGAMKKCPSARVLLDFARGDQPADVAANIKRCRQCGRLVKDITGFQGLARDGRGVGRRRPSTGQEAPLR